MIVFYLSHTYTLLNFLVLGIFHEIVVRMYELFRYTGLNILPVDLCSTVCCSLSPSLSTFPWQCINPNSSVHFLASIGRNPAHRHVNNCLANNFEITFEECSVCKILFINYFLR